MKTREKGLSVLIAFLAVVAVAPPVWALTAQEIVSSVVDNLDNVSDYSASVDIDYDSESVSDMSDGVLQWKRSGGNWKTKTVLGTPYTGEVRTDGITGLNIWDKDGQLWYILLNDGEVWVRANWGSDMFNMERILVNGSWTKDPNTETVNSIECYRLYNSSYEVWVDTATVTKVIRAKAYDGSSRLDYQLDYSNYSNVESTAQLPATIVVKQYDDNEELVVTATYAFSDVNINEGLSDATFSISAP